MKHIKLFENFLFENSNYDKSTLLYLEGNITYNEWENRFDKLNENKIGDYIQNKIIPIFNTIKNNIKTIGLKGIKILQKIYNTIKKFSQKYPEFFKFVIVLIVMSLISISTAVAHNDTTELKSNTIELSDIEKKEFNEMKMIIFNSAIGLIDKMQNSLVDDGVADLMDILKAKAYLIDLKDGKIDEPRILSDKVKTLSNLSIKTIMKMFEENNLSIDLYNIGKKYIDFSYNFTQTYNGHKENLYFKKQSQIEK